jgi:hypothetical protein
LAQVSIRGGVKVWEDEKGKDEKGKDEKGTGWIFICDKASISSQPPDE